MQRRSERCLVPAASLEVWDSRALAFTVSGALAGALAVIVSPCFDLRLKLQLPPIVIPRFNA